MKNLILYNQVLKNDLDFLKQEVSLKREGAVVISCALSVEIGGSLAAHSVMKQFVSGTTLSLLSAGVVMIAALGTAKTMIVLSNKLTIPKVKRFKQEQDAVRQELAILIKELEHSFDIKTTLEHLEKSDISVRSFEFNGGSIRDYDIELEDTLGTKHNFTQRVIEETKHKPFIETFQRERKLG